MITIDTGTLERLQEIRRQLTAYRTVCCRLVHEQVVKVISDGTNGMQRQLVLKGFCRKEFRNTALGCAHTTGNYRFSKLADEAHGLGALGNGPSPSLAIDAAVQVIYLLDHEKGDVEKSMAIARERSGEAAASEFLPALADIDHRYEAASARLEALRSDVLERLDRALLPIDASQHIDK